MGCCSSNIDKHSTSSSIVMEYDIQQLIAFICGFVKNPSTCHILLTKSHENVNWQQKIIFSRVCILLCILVNELNQAVEVCITFNCDQIEEFALRFQKHIETQLEKALQEKVHKNWIMVTSTRDETLCFRKMIH